ncbi:hypothetical protein KUCAC02_002771, partial [Chaenocephalus aceratus]
FLEMESKLTWEEIAESERLLRANLQAVQQRNIQCDDLNGELSQLQFEKRSLHEEVETTRSRAGATQLEYRRKLAEAVTEITLLHHTLRGIQTALNDQAAFQLSYSSMGSPAHQHEFSGVVHLRSVSLVSLGLSTPLPNRRHGAELTLIPHYPSAERMDSTAVLLLLTVTAGTLLHALGTESVTALYGETIVVPCNDGAPAPEDLMFVKWKYEKDDGTPGDLLIQQARSSEATVQATDQYAPRVSIDHKLSLRITQASLRDQKTFTCMVVSGSNLMEYPVTVSVCKEPSSVQIMDRSAALQKDRATAVGTCVAADAHPAATITWKKNGKPLVADGKNNRRISLTLPLKDAIINIGVGHMFSMKLDPASGLSPSSSTLQYAASKEDNVSVFSCMSTHQLTNQEAELEPFPIH